MLKIQASFIIMKNFFFVFFLFVISYSFSQQNKKSVKAIRAIESPTIDGVLNEDFWRNAEIANDFVMFQPGDGTKERASKKTEIKVAYDNEAIYFGATMFDGETEKIPLQFTSRDEFGNTDVFTVSIDPLNNGQNETRFIVMSSGAQADSKVNKGQRDQDLSWNAVWESDVKINKGSWVVEIKIPYSALRFNNADVQTWGINFIRKINYLNEEYVWNYVDKSIGDFSQYAGTITDLENIKPPTRLSFYPYASAKYSSYEGDNRFDASFGLDIKYGLSESYTLDVTLVPDFGQTAFDEAVLNLGPFEQHYSEKRAFFTEGTELFSKGGLFYSRRIGNTPVGYYDVEDNLEEDEEITNNPANVNMINAIKLSGRDKNGLGIGIFNAITEKTYATIKNTITGETKKEVTEPLTNYNVFVIDQQFNKNSSVSFVNTNVLRNGSFRDANTSALLFDIADKESKYNVYGNLKMSNIKEDGANISGYAGFLRLAKTYGNYQYSISHYRADDSYNIQDLGFQRRNNYSNYSSSISYQIFEPTKTFDRLSISLEGSLRYLNEPNVYTSNDLELDAFFMTSKRLAYGLDIEANIGDQYDYYEPRVDGRYIKQAGVIEMGAWVSSDYRKRFAIDLRGSYAKRYNENNYFYGFTVEPRFRFSDKFEMIYELEFSNLLNQKGYVEELEDETIIFGIRDQKNIINTLSSKYSFSTKSSVSLSFRHYWSPVTYEGDYYVLNDEGLLDPSSYEENNDINYNIWNLDLSYSWEFAPGSFLVALYRNSIFNEDDYSYLDFGENLDNLFNEPISNEVSVKFIYYLDYNVIKAKLKS